MRFNKRKLKEVPDDDDDDDFDEGTGSLGTVESSSAADPISTQNLFTLKYYKKKQRFYKMGLDSNSKH